LRAQFLHNALGDRHLRDDRFAHQFFTHACVAGPVQLGEPGGGAVATEKSAFGIVAEHGLVAGLAAAWIIAGRIVAGRIIAACTAPQPAEAAQQSTQAALRRMRRQADLTARLSPFRALDALRRAEGAAHTLRGALRAAPGATGVEFRGRGQAGHGHQDRMQD
jgi:hypothetical protein